MLNRTTFMRRIYQVQEDGNGSSLGGLGDNGLLAAADAFGEELAGEYGDQQPEPQKQQKRQPKQPESEPDADDDDYSDFDDDDLDAEDEPDAEDDSEVDEDDSETDDDTDEADDSEPEKHTVKINGEDVEVTTDELTQGYLRQADYTQKTQALSQERSQLRQQAQELETNRAQYGQKLQQIEDALRSYEMPQSWWDNLYQQDPDKYAEELHNNQRRDRQLQQIRAEREKVEGETAQQRQQEAQQQLEEQREQLKVLMPEWVDQARQQADMSRLSDYGQSVGFSSDELRAITDARAVKVLNDAARWRQLQDKRGKAKKGEGETGAPAKSKKRSQGKKISTTRPRNQNPNQSRSRKAAQSLKKTGSTRDAENFFLSSGLADY